MGASPSPPTPPVCRRHHSRMLSHVLHLHHSYSCIGQSSRGTPGPMARNSSDRPLDLDARDLHGHSREPYNTKMIQSDKCK